MQDAPQRLEAWAQEWLVTVDERKATYTNFSIATKEQSIHLQVNGHVLNQDKMPTYLGITPDPRMTWKPQMKKNALPEPNYELH